MDDGSPLGSEFQVNTYTGMDRISPSVAADPNGNFMVVWGDYYGLLARRYDSTGTPLGSEQFLAQYGGNMDVAADASGQFIVVWPGVSTVVVGQRFDSTGAALGSEFQVEDAPYDPAPITISDAAVAVSESGDFAITWRRRIEPEDDSDPPTDVFARVYDSAGQPRGDAFVVSKKHRVDGERRWSAAHFLLPDLTPSDELRLARLQEAPYRGIALQSDGDLVGMSGFCLRTGLG